MSAWFRKRGCFSLDLYLKSFSLLVSIDTVSVGVIPFRTDICGTISVQVRSEIFCFLETCVLNLGYFGLKSKERVALVTKMHRYSAFVVCLVYSIIVAITGNQTLSVSQEYLWMRRGRVFYVLRV